MRWSENLLKTSRLFILTSILVIAAFFTGLAHNPPQFIQGDIWIWINDSKYAISCLHDDLKCSDISKFPIAYLANSSILNLSSSLTGLSYQQSVLLLNLIFAALYILFLLALMNTKKIICFEDCHRSSCLTEYN